MQKRIASAVLLLALITPLYAARPAKTAAKPAPRAVTVDTHADTPSEFLDHPFDLGVLNSRGHFDYPRMKAGGLDAEFFAAYVPAKYANKGAAAYCMKIMETIHEMADSYPAWVRFATSTAGIRSAVAENKRAIHRHRRRPRHRGLARSAPRLLPFRRALHDPDAHEHEQLG